jgi:hypothetical protein
LDGDRGKVGTSLRILEWMSLVTTVMDGAQTTPNVNGKIAYSGGFEISDFAEATKEFEEKKILGGLDYYGCTSDHRSFWVRLNF